MIRFLSFAVIAFSIYAIFLYISSDEVSKAKRIRFIRNGALFFLAIGLLVASFTYYQENRVREQLEAQGFEQTEDERYQIDIGEYRFLLDYEKGYMSKASTVPRLDIVASTPPRLQSIKSYFCDDKEFQRFVEYSYGGWYPTPEIKLANGHFVGKCFPADVVTAVAALPAKSNNFQPRSARYLFFPSQTESNKGKVFFYTENLKIESLKQHLEEFISYYDLLK